MSVTVDPSRTANKDELMEDKYEPHLDDLTDDVEVLQKKIKAGKDLMDPHK